ncbi:hypothetical protein ACH4UM_37895 [Streptomyces sp. NPDC020801]|uniref:hypothetical protein n=1 Tax=Streptomyces sp. NPDC020801 TaxID=3365093 RepID=UPI0037A104A7
MTHNVILAGEFANIGDHLLQVGNGWADGTLKLGLLAIVVITVIKKLSIKAGIGALLGLVVATAVYNGRADISNAFKDEVTNIKGAPATHAPLIPGGAAPIHQQPTDGERA